MRNFFKRKSLQAVLETGKTSGLVKSLTLIDLIFLGLGGIIGTGVFTLTGVIAAEYAGPAVIVSYAIAGIACIFIALVYTELASMIPTSGSIYTYSYVAFGEVFAWMIASMLIVEMGLGAAAVSSGWSAYVQGLFDAAGCPLPQALINCPSHGGFIDLPAFLIVLTVGVMLFLGTKESKTLNNILVVVKMVAILLFVIFAAPHFDINNWQNFMPKGFDDVMYGSSILFFAFTGFGVLAATAEECKNPEKDLTIGIIGSLVLATVVYMLVAAALTGITPYYELNNPQSLAYALKQNGSNIGSMLVAIGGIAGMTTVIMVNIYGQSRIFYVVARDGLIPKFMSKIHPKYDSPYMTILVFTVFVALAGSLVPFNTLAQLSSMGALTDYVVVGLVVIFFRFKEPNIRRPFKCPAIYIIAPIALLASLYLLTKQIFDVNGNLLPSGQTYLYWLAGAFGLYLVKLVSNYICNKAC